MTARAPGALAAVWTLAVVTWLRLVRGRALWIGLVIACVPIVYAGIARDHLGLGRGTELLTLEILVLAVLAPMFVASSIGEDIEDRTATYLWSRPIPRWAVYAGKLAALVPVTTALVLASWALASHLRSEVSPPASSFLALGLGTLTVSLIATGISSLAPRHGMALTIVYMLFFDLSIGAVPAKIAEASASYHVRHLAEMGGGARAAIALGVLGGLWALVALWRVRRLET